MCSPACRRAAADPERVPAELESERLVDFCGCEGHACSLRSGGSRLGEPNEMRLPSGSQTTKVTCPTARVAHRPASGVPEHARRTSRSTIPDAPAGVTRRGSADAAEQFFEGGLPGSDLGQARVTQRRHAVL